MRRLLAAAALASFVGVLAVATAIYCLLLFQYPPSRQSITLSSFWGGAFFLLLLGWPLAFAVTATIGTLGIVLAHRAHRRLPLPLVAGLAVVLGAVTFELASGLFWWSTDIGVRDVAVGAFGGLVTGVVFWMSLGRAHWSGE